ncbi:MAG: hypothetical protein P8017_07800 [Deltaproteobacteria bacterium]
MNVSFFSAQGLATGAFLMVVGVAEALRASAPLLGEIEELLLRQP